MDGRRRQWIKWDVFFNDGDLGSAIRERFGVCGMTVFQSFLSACKRSSVQGQMSYGNDLDALATMGLPGLVLLNEKGEEWTLDEFWTFLGQRKQIRRRRRGRITDVLSTRWEQWQNTPPTQPERTKKPTSPAGITGEKESDTALESESESESEKSSSSSDEMTTDDDVVNLLVEWKRQAASNITNPPGWTRTVTAETRTTEGPFITASRAQHPDWPAERHAAYIRPELEPPRLRIHRAARAAQQAEATA